MNSPKQIKSNHSLHYRDIVNLLAELLLGGTVVQLLSLHSKKVVGCLLM